MWDGQVRETISLRRSTCRSASLSPRTEHVQSLDVRAGDRLVMLTDGMLEDTANSVDLSDLIVRIRGLHPREAGGPSSP